MGNNDEVLEKENNAESAEVLDEKVEEFDSDEEMENAEGTENIEVSDEVKNEETEKSSNAETTKDETNSSISEESKSKKSKINKKKIAITAGIAAAVLVAVYGGGVVYYSNHFFFNTEIGNFECANLTVAQAEEKIQNEIDNYTFTFYEKDGKKETITGEEIQLKCSPVENLDELKDRQNAFAWFIDSSNRSLPLDIEVEYNTDNLYNRITQMDFSQETRENMEGAFDGIYYENGTYSVKDDGTKDIVSVNSIYDKVKPKINELYKGMSLEKESCYGGLAEDDNMKGVLNLLNRYASTVVNYKKGDKTIVLDCGSINEWLKVGENYSVEIDEEQLKEYVKTLAYEYDTVGRERKFTTTGGEEITISGGNYGWLVDQEQEAKELVNVISGGGTVEREPVFKQTAAALGEDNDLSNTYVEISIGAQHLWYYKDGEQVLSTDIVTGNPFRNNATPTGIYHLAYKEKNAVLRGPGYASPVSFWMPFNGGIGLHDATWRGSFGGTIYKGGGSHGCVNMPYKAAAAIYEVISPGDPVVVY